MNGTSVANHLKSQECLKSSYSHSRDWLSFECSQVQTFMEHPSCNIDHGQIRHDLSCIEAIVNIPPPKKPLTLKEFLKMAQFWHHFVP